MRSDTIKRALFSFTAFAAFSAHAGELEPGLHYIEELPMEKRVLAHEAVLKYLNAHPEAAHNAQHIVYDEKGTLYVLDGKLENKADVGGPSCFP